MGLSIQHPINNVHSWGSALGDFVNMKKLLNFFFTNWPLQVHQLLSKSGNLCLGKLFDAKMFFKIWAPFRIGFRFDSVFGIKSICPIGYESDSNFLGVLWAKSSYFKLNNDVLALFLGCFTFIWHHFLY